jgi:hypothetical protein
VWSFVLQLSAPKFVKIRHTSLAYAKFISKSAIPVTKNIYLIQKRKIFLCLPLWLNGLSTPVPKSAEVAIAIYELEVEHRGQIRKKHGCDWLILTAA